MTWTWTELLSGWLLQGFIKDSSRLDVLCKTVMSGVYKNLLMWLQSVWGAEVRACAEESQSSGYPRFRLRWFLNKAGCKGLSLNNIVWKSVYVKKDIFMYQINIYLVSQASKCIFQWIFLVFLVGVFVVIVVVVHFFCGGEGGVRKSLLKELDFSKSTGKRDQDISQILCWSNEAVTSFDCLCAARLWCSVPIDSLVRTQAGSGVGGHCGDGGRSAAENSTEVPWR